MDLINSFEAGKLTVAQYDKIIDLENQTFENIASYGEYKIDRSKYPELTVSYLQDIFEKRIWNYVVAIEDSTIVGCAIFRLDHDFHTQKREAYVQILCVDKNHRGKGIGKALVDEVMQVLKAQGCEQNISLWHHSSNLSAGDFYLKAGFENTIGRWAFLEKNVDAIDFEK